MGASDVSIVTPELGPGDYAGWRRSAVGAITEQLERELILELVGDVRGLKILDVGCGDGALALELWKRGASVTGIDASAAMIDAATARAKAQNADITFRVALAEHAPFLDQQFDIVTAVTILCFVGDAAPVFREIARVLRPRGRLVIGELGRWSSWAAARRLRAWLGAPLWRQARFRTAKELRSLAENAGLTVEAVRGAIFYPRWSPAARLLSRLDRRLGRLTTFGAAFVALSAAKPAGERNRR
jgi:ubiquinone biosynthesis O-methyltransferase